MLKTLGADAKTMAAGRKNMIAGGVLCLLSLSNPFGITVAEEVNVGAGRDIRGMPDLQNELKVADEFWDFLGGQGAYLQLLDIFERVGIELRPEIDNYFTEYNRP